MINEMGKKQKLNEIVPSTEGRVNFQVWLKGDEKYRYEEVLRRVFSRSRGDAADVNRRLLGLESDTDGFVKDEDVLFFRGESNKISVKKSVRHDTSTPRIKKGVNAQKLVKEK